MNDAIQRVCRSCGQSFTIDVDEQEWFAELARVYPERSVSLPKQCPSCRQARRRAGIHRSPRDWSEPETKQHGEA
jgi:hypothetical protein